MPLPHGQHMAIFCFKTAAALVGLVSTNSQVKTLIWFLPYSFTERLKSRSEHMWPPESRQWEDWALPLSPPRQLPMEVGDLIKTSSLESRWRIRRPQSANRNNKIKDVVGRVKRPMKKGRVEVEDLKGWIVTYHNLRKADHTAVPMLIQKVISKALKPV